MTDSLMIGVTGVAFSAPSGSASASATLPNTSDGNPPKYVRVSVASGSIYFRMDPSSATALTTDPIVSVSDSMIFAVSGNRKFSAYGIGGVVVGVVTPLENAR
jgi:hypothetical protein